MQSPLTTLTLSLINSDANGNLLSLPPWMPMTSMPGGGPRERILAATAKLLAEGGREAASTRAVGAAAGVQAPTIYRLFGDKQGLLDAVAARGLRRLPAPGRPTGSPPPTRSRICAPAGTCTSGSAWPTRPCTCSCTANRASAMPPPAARRRRRRRGPRQAHPADRRGGPAARQRGTRGAARPGRRSRHDGHPDRHARRTAAIRRCPTLAREAVIAAITTDAPAAASPRTGDRRRHPARRAAPDRPS